MCDWNTVCHKGGPVNQLAQHQGWPPRTGCGQVCVGGGGGMSQAHAWGSSWSLTLEGHRHQGPIPALASPLGSL